jgi:drug/metabolite transporter (DMT)-like permease
MVILDIIAPIFLMLGLKRTTPANVSLLNNFEIVATATIALMLFKESIGKRMWIAITFITLSTIILSVDDFTAFSFSLGSLFILFACICWGLENNCTSRLSLHDPMQIVVIKGLGSGFGALIIALCTGEISITISYIIVALCLGFIAYGLSIYFYILAQRELGAARTSSYYAVSPFIGVIVSFILFKEKPSLSFIIAFIIMVMGSYFAVSERHKHNHIHNIMEHEHKHNHNDGHNVHIHEPPFNGEHNHIHGHQEIIHEHIHTPDLHHTHNNIIKT